VGGLHGGTGFDAPDALLFALMVAPHARRGAAAARARLAEDPPRGGRGGDHLLLNFIVLLFVSAMLDGPMKDPGAMGWPQSVASSRNSN